MDIDFVNSSPVQQLLDNAAGVHEDGGDARTKAIMRDLLQGIMKVIVSHDVTEDEFWSAVKFLQDGAGEFGLIIPGLGLEHFMDLVLDARDTEAGRGGGTPRTIEGPLYVAGAPLVEGDVCLTDDADETDTLYMAGQVTGPSGEPVRSAILHVWQADSKGFYSQFDPTHEQSPFNNRRRIKLAEDGRYKFHSKAPHGYSVPPQGAADRLMKALGRHGNRPAHVHFIIEAPGYRTLTTQINFGDDPFAADDFAFGTREGLLPVPNRQGESVFVEFDFRLERAESEHEQRMSARPRAAA
jgi:catechol 1,2-dioxygenase